MWSFISVVWGILLSPWSALGAPPGLGAIESPSAGQQSADRLAAARVFRRDVTTAAADASTEQPAGSAKRTTAGVMLRPADKVPQEANVPQRAGSDVAGVLYEQRVRSPSGPGSASSKDGFEDALAKGLQSSKEVAMAIGEAVQGPLTSAIVSGLEAAGQKIPGEAGQDQEKEQEIIMARVGKQVLDDPNKEDIAAREMAVEIQNNLKPTVKPAEEAKTIALPAKVQQNATSKKADLETLRRNLMDVEAELEAVRVKENAKARMAMARPKRRPQSSEATEHRHEAAAATPAQDNETLGKPDLDAKTREAMRPKADAPQNMETVAKNNGSAASDKATELPRAAVNISRVVAESAKLDAVADAPPVLETLAEADGKRPDEAPSPATGESADADAKFESVKKHSFPVEPKQAGSRRAPVPDARTVMVPEPPQDEGADKMGPIEQRYRDQLNGTASYKSIAAQALEDAMVREAQAVLQKKQDEEQESNEDARSKGRTHPVPVEARDREEEEDDMDDEDEAESKESDSVAEKRRRIERTLGNLKHDKGKLQALEAKIDQQIRFDEEMLGMKVDLSAPGRPTAATLTSSSSTGANTAIAAGKATVALSTEALSAAEMALNRSTEAEEKLAEGLTKLAETEDMEMRQVRMMWAFIVALAMALTIMAFFWMRLIAMKQGGLRGDTSYMVPLVGRAASPPEAGRALPSRR